MTDNTMLEICFMCDEMRQNCLFIEASGVSLCPSCKDDLDAINAEVEFL
jgi:hypothetical protein